MDEKKVYKIGLLPLILLVLDIILIIVIIIMGLVIKHLINKESTKTENTTSDKIEQQIPMEENNLNVLENSVNTNENKVANDNTNIINNTTTDNSNFEYIGKIVENKSYIYEAQYSSSNVQTRSYYTNDEVQHNISEIVVPYINMNSNDALEMNSEIENMYNGYLNEFNICSQNQNSFIKVNYETYVTANINSILITIKRGKEGTESIEYVAYNFDTISGTKLDYNQVCYIANIIDAAQSIQDKIDSLEDFNDYYIIVDKKHNQEAVDERNTEISKNKAQIYTYYQQDLLNNKLVYFLDNNLKLNIALNVVLPEENESYLKIVTI